MFRTSRLSDVGAAEMTELAQVKWHRRDPDPVSHAVP
jgi:hypothetical protein